MNPVNENNNPIKFKIILINIINSKVIFLELNFFKKYMMNMIIIRHKWINFFLNSMDNYI